MPGKLQFQLQKYQVQGQGRSYFELSQQLTEGYISPRLQEFCAYYSNRLSYKEVEKLVERITGEPEGATRSLKNTRGKDLTELW